MYQPKKSREKARGVDPSEPLEPGEIAGVVDVPVGQDNRIDRARIDRKRLPVAKPKLLESLIEAALHKEPPARFQEELRPRDGADAPPEIRS